MTANKQARPCFRWGSTQTPTKRPPEGWPKGDARGAMTARTARATVGQEIGSVGKFIAECLEHHQGGSERLGMICLRYQQWCQEKQVVSVPAFRERFLRVV